jgi:hypothetical protein
VISSNDILESSILDYKVFPFDDSIKEAVQGKGGKKVLIAFSNEQTKEITDFLEKVFKAVQLNLPEDTFLLAVPKGKRFWFHKLAKELEVEKAIFFGIHPVSAGMNVENKSYFPFNINGITFLFADELDLIFTSQDLKKRLWDALQTVFPQSK